LHKEDVIKQALEATVLGSTNAKNFLELLSTCYNPFITFGVKQVNDTVAIFDQENPWEEFKELLGKLHSRALTGNNARDAIENISHRFDSSEWNNFCAPVIRRDIRAGVSEKTINKICKGTDYEVPTFGCQLATNSENRPEMRGVKRLEPKLDGVRVLMMVIPTTAEYDNVNVVSFSRNGKIFENFTHIEEQIKNNFAQLIRKNISTLVSGFVLDGEVVGNSFQELMRQARRKENVQATDSVFHVFDIIPIKDFRRGYWNAQLHKRIKILESMRETISNMPNVELLTYIDVDLDTSEGRDVLHRYAKDKVNEGYEGIMIKSVDAPYECKRNTFWMKWKPTITVDLVVKELEEGTGRNKGRLGALVCEGTDDGKFITVNVGSGYSDEDRDSYWNNRTSVIGRTVEILCDSITLNQDNTYSLRFPRFLRFRDDK
jgi:DNA ligase-1